ncbi:hypothetical protein D7Y13_10015 [Corallococcus praedator]|uniref:Carbonic anhydrase n=1 Tax=Corallococcus praedator TaxID=2316724 RepID=A0ABX9QL28_9BACT|nr:MULTISPECIES: carbonic anhydrase [Corallococcus]RKH15016.1 hypothetical protein D7X74_19070 [Corallococcus sp. CA047B]RKH32020.1 hypothetical protein D7X75_17320 [Corallococcus sp. CA031C]RKI12106.1 hypothetical protein D7Y13_10015 [Corallococcus praedator]
MADPAPFVSRVPFESVHPKALAVYCSDGRFTEAVEDLAHHLGHPRIDTLTLPGGPALLNRWASDYLESEGITRAAKFLIEGHHIEDVLLLAHAGCGYYQARHGALGPAISLEQQLKDLHFGAKELQTAYPHLRIHLYFAHPKGKTVEFEHIPREG